MRSRKYAKSFRQFFIATILSSVSLPTSVDAADQLKWVFQKEELVSIEMDQNSVIEESSHNEIKIRQRTSLAWRVIDVDDDGTATLEHTTQRIRLSVSDNEGELNADSDTVEPEAVTNPKIKGLWAIATAPMKSSFRFKLTSFGEIEDYNTNQPRLFEKPTAAIVFPKDGPKIGEPWTVVSRMEQQNFNLAVSTSYQLVGKEVVDGRELAKVKTSTAFRLDKDSNAKLVSQNALGVLWFDPSLGKMVQSENHQQIGIELDLQGSTVQQSISQSTEISYRFESSKR